MNRSYLPKCLQDISAISKDKINYKCLCTLKNGHPHHPLYISYKKMKGLNSFDLNKYLESLPSMQSNMLLSADEIGSRVTNAQFVEFQEKIGVLKHLRRTGWVVRNVPKAETVASHSWRMALMAMQKENELKNLGINSAKVIEMCLLHDVAEAVVGDIMPEEWQTGEGIGFFRQDI